MDMFLPALERIVEGRGKSRGCNPMRLEPDDRLKKSGLNPKSNLCGSICICFCNTEEWINGYRLNTSLKLNILHILTVNNYLI